MKVGFKIEGLKETQITFSKAPQKVRVEMDKLFHDQALKLSQVMKRKAVFTKGYSTGATKKSIRTINYKDKVTVGPRTDYAPYLEHGTRHMEAQPFVRPALKEVEPDFKRELKKLLEKSLKQ